MRKILSVITLLTIAFVGLFGCEFIDDFLGKEDKIPPIVDVLPGEVDSGNVEVEDTNPDINNPGETDPKEEDPDVEDPIVEVPEEEPVDPDPEVELIEKLGFYNQKDDVALYIHTYGELPSNYITKSEVNGHIRYHWTPENLASVGGDRFYNKEKELPFKKSGRIYFEADINYMGQYGRNAERIVYSNDGLIFYTSDHYGTFKLYNPEDGSWNLYSMDI